MIDPHDKIGTELEASDLGLFLYLLFVAAVLVALGVLFGAYVL